MTHAEAHNIFYTKVHQIFDGLSKSQILKQCFSNYRDGRGLCLRKDSYALCVKQKIYTFKAIERPSKFDSRHISLLDKISSSPFYITKYKVYITDLDILFDLTISGDDFDVFLDMHK